MNLANDSISPKKSQLTAALSRRKVFAVVAIGVLTAMLTLLSLPRSDTKAMTQVAPAALEQSEASPAAAGRPEASAATPDVDVTPPIFDYTYN